LHSKFRDQKPTQINMSPRDLIDPPPQHIADQIDEMCFLWCLRDGLDALPFYCNPNRTKNIMEWGPLRISLLLDLARLTPGRHEEMVNGFRRRIDDRNSKIRCSGEQCTTVQDIEHFIMTNQPPAADFPPMVNKSALVPPSDSADRRRRSGRVADMKRKRAEAEPNADDESDDDSPLQTRGRTEKRQRRQESRDDFTLGWEPQGRGKRPDYSHLRKAMGLENHDDRDDEPSSGSKDRDEDPEDDVSILQDVSSGQQVADSPQHGAYFDDLVAFETRNPIPQGVTRQQKIEMLRFIKQRNLDLRADAKDYRAKARDGEFDYRIQIELALEQQEKDQDWADAE
jgi:hypothetical protein